MGAKKIVIVGGVAAGASAAAKARRCSEEAEIIVFEKGPHISYANCGLPYYLSGVIEKRERLLISDPAFFRRRFNVDVRLNHEVIGVDAAAKSISVIRMDNGEHFHETYDKLILAPGADPVVLPIPGADLKFVYTLKTLEDTDFIFQHLHENKVRRAVVIGGGLIGMEAVENLVQRGVETTVVEFLPQVLSFLDPEMAEVVHRHLRDKGVHLQLGEKVTSIDEVNGSGAVNTEQGSYPADIVIMAVGIRPNVKLARDAGLAIGERGGIVVNEEMLTSDPDIYAAGDCVESTNLVTGKKVIFPMGSAANKQGRAAGANALGRKIRVKGFTGTAIVKVFDLAVATTGLSEKQTYDEKMTPYVSYVLGGHIAGYYPGGKIMQMKVIADNDSGRLLGAQIVGEAGVDKRIDVLATALYNRMDVEDLIQLDLAYAPPYASARDLVIVAGAIAQNYYNKDWQPITPKQLKEKLAEPQSFTLVDVRTSAELKRTGIISGAIHIPIDDLRRRLHELNKEKETVLYCAVGLRSYLGNRILLIEGFDNVRTLTGGITAWPYGLENI